MISFAAPRDSRRSTWTPALPRSRRGWTARAGPRSGTSGRWRRRSRAPMSERPPVRAAVVGSGFGGLAAAIRLQAAGVRTTIYERRDQPGGRAYVYRDAGFTFDA